MPIDKKSRYDQLNFLEKINKEHSQSYPHNKELETRIQNYELAARMQLAAGEILDNSKESQAT